MATAKFTALSAQKITTKIKAFPAGTRLVWRSVSGGAGEEENVPLSWLASYNTGLETTNGQGTNNIMLKVFARGTNMTTHLGLQLYIEDGYDDWCNFTVQGGSLSSDFVYHISKIRINFLT